MHYLLMKMLQLIPRFYAAKRHVNLHGLRSSVMVIMTIESMEWWLLDSVHRLIYRCANTSGNWGSCHANLHMGKTKSCHRKTPCLALPLTVIDHDHLWVIWLNWGDTLHVHVICSLPMWLVSPLDTCNIAFNKMAMETWAGCGKWQVSATVWTKI